MVARHPARIARSAALIAAAAVFALPAEAQRTVEWETSQGTITIELIDHPVVAPFANAFLRQRQNLRGAIFHESDKSLQCDVQTCSCLADFDCDTPGGTGVCEDSMAPVFICEDGDLADCECEDTATSPAFSCTTMDGPSFDCPPPPMGATNDLTCSCDDESIPTLACEDGSTLPGTCTEPLVQTDKSMPSAALHLGLQRRNDDGQVVAIAEFVSPTPPDPTLDPLTAGIFQNDPLTVAFVRDSATSELTSEIVINVEDNSDPFDGVSGNGSDAYMVFGTVIGEGQNVVDSIATISTTDLSVQVDDGGMPPQIALACSGAPAPLTYWIQGIPDATRCDVTHPWNEFAVIDFVDADPLPRIEGCFPGEVDCQLPLCTTPGATAGCDVPSCPEVATFGMEVRCTAPLSPACLDLGAPSTDGNGNPVTPCLDPVCEDTFDDSGTTRCTSPPPLNFPVPEPTAGALAGAALAVLAVLRRARRS